LLELEILRANRESGQQVLDVQTLINICVGQIYGIEIEEFPCKSHKSCYGSTITR
jgi:hypothetical protein